MTARDVLAIIAAAATAVSFLVTAMAVLSHWKNYRRPALQRLTVRLLLMVPVYALTSLISILWESDYVLCVEAVRSVYEAFAIYSFFLLLVNCLGGERTLLALLEHRPMIRHPFPFTHCLPPIDVARPRVFLLIRRGIVQFAIFKIFLAIIQLIVGLGNLNALYSASLFSNIVDIIYNISISIALYCLVLFYMQSAKDLAPFHPFPKYVCVKSVIFLSYWQGVFLSLLEYVGILQLESWKINSEYLQNFLICLECIAFAIGYYHAFPWSEYTSQRLSSRIVLRFAIRDSFGTQDILDDKLHL